MIFSYFSCFWQKKGFIGKIRENKRIPHILHAFINLAFLRKYQGFIHLYFLEQVLSPSSLIIWPLCSYRVNQTKPSVAKTYVYNKKKFDSQPFTYKNVTLVEVYSRVHICTLLLAHFASKLNWSIIRGTVSFLTFRRIPKSTTFSFDNRV